MNFINEKVVQIMSKLYGEREEPKVPKEMSMKELYENLNKAKSRYKTAKERFEFNYSTMLFEEIRILTAEINKRNKKDSSETLNGKGKIDNVS